MITSYLKPYLSNSGKGILHICNLIENVLHHGRSPYNSILRIFPIFSLTGCANRAFQLRAFIVIFTACFHCYLNFANAGEIRETRKK